MDNKNKIKQGSMAVDVIFYILAFFVCIITLYPMYYVFIMSISDPIEVFARSVNLYPKGLYFGSYKLIFRDNKMWKAFTNSFIYVVSGTFLCCFTSVIAAYPLTAKNLIGRKWIVRYLIFTMYFGGGLIPTFLLMQKLGLYNNRLAIIIPGAVSVWYIILTRTYFMTLPASLRESAFIDGANNFHVLFKIYIPLSKPILAVIAIYSIVGIWNSWFSAMIYLPNEELHPLQMYLVRVLVQQTVDLTKLAKDDYEEAFQMMLQSVQLQYAMIIFTSLPIIFTYPYFQKYFIKGVMLGSLKE